MGSPLGPVLARISMVQSKRSFVILLTAQRSFWKRYVDDSINFIKIGAVDCILSILNKLHRNIQVTHETEYNLKLAFLDVMV